MLLLFFHHKYFNAYASLGGIVPKLHVHDHLFWVTCQYCNVYHILVSLIDSTISLFISPAMYEGVYVASGDTSLHQPTLFVMSCGEGHLDLRTADKVLQTLQAKESGQSGLPSPATILSDKNYLMVWDINAWKGRGFLGHMMSHDSLIQNVCNRLGLEMPVLTLACLDQFIFFPSTLYFVSSETAYPFHFDIYLFYICTHYMLYS